MKHQVFGRKLGRDLNQRRALLQNLASALIVSGHITTTLAKAKFVKPYAEKLITQAAKNKLDHNRRVASQLSADAFRRLFKEVAPQFDKRSGGYTRIIKTKPRIGDGAPMARIELLPIEKKVESKPTEDKSVKKSDKSVTK